MYVDVHLVVERMGVLVEGSRLTCQCVGPVLWCMVIGRVVFKSCMDELVDVHGRYASGCGMTG